SNVSAKTVVRLDGRGNLFGVLRTDALIHVLSPVAVRPAVESVFLNRGKIIRHQVWTNLITFVHHRPQLARVGLYGERGGIAQARRVDFVFATVGAYAPYLCAIHFRCHAPFGDIAVGPDAHVQVLPVRAGGQGFGPVMIDV